MIATKKIPDPRTYKKYRCIIINNNGNISGPIYEKHNGTLKEFIDICEIYMKNDSSIKNIDIYDNLNNKIIETLYDFTYRPSENGLNNEN